MIPVADARLEHTCNPAKPGKALPFGKPDPTGKCLRCAERAAEREQGIPAREPHPRIQWTIDRRQRDAQRSREIEKHFAPGGGHENCGPISTCFDW